MNRDYVILFTLVLASIVSSEIVKSRTEFIARRKYNGELEMQNENKLFRAQKYQTVDGRGDRLGVWRIDDEPYTEHGFVFVRNVSEEWQVDGNSNVIYASWLSESYYSRMYRRNGTLILEHLQQHSRLFPILDTFIGTRDIFHDYTYTARDGQVVLSFSRRWLSLVTKYAVTMEPGTNSKDNFAAFVMFYELQHGNISDWS